MEHMSINKQTPGPWVYAPRDHGQFVMSRNFVVARCGDSGNYAAEANARLIAAAPDLLNALQAIRLECLADPLNPCWNNRPTDVAGKHWGVGDACTSCNARAAIAKAIGMRS